MAMSSGASDEKPMSDINATPLVDVMLVLLIIFLIAVPVVVQNIKVKLPNVRFDPTTTKPENVSLAITSKPDGSVPGLLEHDSGDPYRTARTVRSPS